MSQIVEYKSRVKEIKNLLAGTAEAHKGIAARGFNFEQAYRIYYMAISRSPKLLLCTNESIARCLVDSASLGLYLGPTLSQCYAVPFKNKNLTGALNHEAQFMLGYQGMIELVRRTKLIKSISTELVYDKDEFDCQKGLNPVLRHIPYGYGQAQWPEVAAGRLDRGKLIFGYCLTEFIDGGHHIEVLTFDQMEARRKRSKAKDDGPWVTDKEPMYRKCPVRAAWPFLPKTPEMMIAMALDERVEEPDVAGDAIVTPIVILDSGEAVDVKTGEVEEQTEAEKLADELAGGESVKHASEPTQDPQPKAAGKRGRPSKPKDDPKEPEKAIAPPRAPGEVKGGREPWPSDFQPAPETAADVNVDLGSAKDSVDGLMKKLEKGHQNILQHQFKKKHGHDWTESQSVDDLSKFYDDIDEALRVL